MLGLVKEAKEGRDGFVRSCTVTYTVPNMRDPMNVYSGGKKITVTRGVQRLTLLLPVEEQSCEVIVEENRVKSYSKEPVSNNMENSVNSYSVESVKVNSV